MLVIIIANGSKRESVKQFFTYELKIMQDADVKITNNAWKYFYVKINTYLRIIQQIKSH